MSVMDKSNAFTAMKTREWMYYYFGCPEVRAAEVWRVLPAELKQITSPLSLVTPLYTRRSMGSSHSVHILMSINMNVIVKSLIQNFMPIETWDKLQVTLTSGAEARKSERGASCRKDSQTPKTKRGPNVHSPAAFRERARRAKSSSAPVFVVLHCFAGGRR